MQMRGLEEGREGNAIPQRTRTLASRPSRMAKTGFVLAALAVVDVVEVAVVFV